MIFRGILYRSCSILQNRKTSSIQRHTKSVGEQSIRNKSISGLSSLDGPLSEECIALIHFDEKQKGKSLASLSSLIMWRYRIRGESRCNQIPQNS